MIDVIVMLRALSVALVLLLAGARTASADNVRDLIRDLASDPDYKVRLKSVLFLGRIDDPRSFAACVPPANRLAPNPCSAVPSQAAAAAATP